MFLIPAAIQQNHSEKHKYTNGLFFFYFFNKYAAHKQFASQVTTN